VETQAQTQTEQTVKILRDGEGPIVPDQRITNEQTKAMPDNCLVVPMVLLPRPERIPKSKTR